MPCGSLRQAHTGGREQEPRTAGTWSREQAGAAGNEVRISDFVPRAGAGRRAGEPRNQQAGTQKAARMFLSQTA